MRRLMFAGLALLVVPTIALAGKTTTLGTNTLRIEAAYKPAKTSKNFGAFPRAIRMKVDYFARTTDGSPNPSWRNVRIMTGGPEFNWLDFPQCRYSEVARPDFPRACESDEKVGRGTAVAEIHGDGGTTTPVKGDVAIYNAYIDIDEEGKRRSGLKEGDGLLLIVDVGDGVVIPLDSVKGNRGVELRNPVVDPEPSYGIREMHLTIYKRGSARAGLAFLAAPAKCKGSWVASATNTPYGGEPIKATDKVKCTKA